MKRWITFLLISLCLLPVIFCSRTPEVKLGYYNVKSIKTYPGEVNTVELYGNLLLIGNGSNLEAYSVENPDSPAFLNRITLNYKIFEIRIISMYINDTSILIALVFCGYYGVYIVNVTVTTHMNVIKMLSLGGVSIDGIKFYGSRIILSNGSLVEVDTSTWNYTTLTITEGTNIISFTNIRYITAHNKYLYCGLDNGSVAVLSSSGNYGENFTYERMVMVCENPIDEILVKEMKLYIAARNNGLYVYDISTPAVPRYSGHTETRGYSHKICVLSNYLYIADGGEGISIFDLNEFNYLKNIGYHDTTYYMRDIAVKNYRIYGANSMGGLWVYLHECQEVKGVIIDWPFLGWISAVTVTGVVSYLFIRRRA